MKILIIGASSFIGNEIYRLAKNLDIPVIGTTNSKIDHELYKFDIVRDRIDDFVRSHIFFSGEDEICAVIAASICKINQCYENQELSYAVNVAGTKRLLKFFHENHIRTLFLSSEAVFDGRKGFYSEEDVTNPLCLYGSHKVEIENYILKSMPEFMIFRLSMIFGDSIRNDRFFKEIYMKHLRSENLKNIEGRVISPTYVKDIACCVIVALKKHLNGMFHVANPVSMSRYDIVKSFLEALKSTSIVENVPLEYFKFKEGRALDSSLDVRKFNNHVDIQYIPMTEIIQRIVNNIVRQRDQLC